MVGLGSARRIAAGLAVTALVVAGPFGATAARASGTSTISGTAFQDSNRNGVQDPGEIPFAGHVVYLFNGSGSSFIASATTDSNGHYSFGGLADGAYVVGYSSSTWDSLRDTWVPTTVGGSLHPQVNVSLSGSATVNFGWRQIIRSTTAGSPISSYVGANGLQVRSYDDAVTAQTVFNDVTSGSLIGPEAAHETIQFDLGTATSTGTSVAGSPGSYTGYSAISTISWDSYLDTQDGTLFHEYGVAWSLYYAYIVQQDPTLTGYLQARGLYGNSLVGSSQIWDPREMVAEDYRELFGTSTAQAMAQMNYQIPPANQVPGLATYLSTTFRQPPAVSVSITSPATGSTVSGTITVSGGAGGAPNSVAISVDGGAFTTASGTSTWSSALNTMSLANGSHTVTARATNANGATASSQVSIRVANDVTISGLTVSPSPLKSSGSASFAISMPATVTVTITTAGGSVVKTLLTNASEPAGSVSAGWDRTNSSGKRVSSGTYVAKVVATDASGFTATSTVSFSVQ